MKRSKGGWTFVIEDIGSTRRALGDKLTLTDAGWAKLWAGETLVGVFRQGSWTRIYVEPTAPKAETT